MNWKRAAASCRLIRNNAHDLCQSCSALCNWFLRVVSLNGFEWLLEDSLNIGSCFECSRELSEHQFKTQAKGFPDDFCGKAHSLSSCEGCSCEAKSLSRVVE